MSSKDRERMHRFRAFASAVPIASVSLDWLSPLRNGVDVESMPLWMMARRTGLPLVGEDFDPSARPPHRSRPSPKCSEWNDRRQTSDKRPREHRLHQSESILPERRDILVGLVRDDPQRYMAIEASTALFDLGHLDREPSVLRNAGDRQHQNDGFVIPVSNEQCENNGAVFSAFGFAARGLTTPQEGKPPHVAKARCGSVNHCRCCSEGPRSAFPPPGRRGRRHETRGVSHVHGSAFRIAPST